MAIQEAQQLQKAKGGVFYGYYIVALSFLIIMLNGGALYTFGIFFKPLLKEFGWTAKISLRDGIESTYKWFLNNRSKTRQ